MEYVLGPLIVIALMCAPIVVYGLFWSPWGDERREKRQRQSKIQELRSHVGVCGCTCGVCRAPIVGGHDAWFRQHTCPGFGRLTCCGYEVTTSSGSDVFTHFCPPTIARQQLAVEREMERQRAASGEEA